MSPIHPLYIYPMPRQFSLWNKILKFYSIAEFVLGLAQVSSDCADEERRLKFIFRIYDMDRDGYISNGELFQVS